jgi:hypothetical protein
MTALYAHPLERQPRGDQGPYGMSVQHKVVSRPQARSLRAIPPLAGGYLSSGSDGSLKSRS